MDIERKSFPFELDEKGLDPEARTFQGYASVFGNVDDGGDVIVKGAFKKTLQEMGERIKVYFIHDFMQPIGKLLEAKEVARGQLPAKILERAPDATGGLFVKGYISETTKGNDALTLLRDSVLDELSIGYKSVNEDMKDGEEGQGVLRYLKEVKLLDVSPVPLAMNAAAMVTGVKLAELAQRRADDTGLTVEEAYEELANLCAKDRETELIEGVDLDDMEKQVQEQEEVDEKELAARTEALGKLLEAKIEQARAMGRR